MTFGPGKYDDICTKIRAELGISDYSDGGCVVLIVMGGNRGPGFSVQADLESSLLLPDMLEDVARQIRRDLLG